MLNLQTFYQSRHSIADEALKVLFSYDTFECQIGLSLSRALEIGFDFGLEVEMLSIVPYS